MRCGFLFASAMAGVCLFASMTSPQESTAQEATKFTVADGKLEFKAPASWAKKTPKVRIIEVEYEVPAAKGDELAGRMTVMARSKPTSIAGSASSINRAAATPRTRPRSKN
jgi:hypothetical protein